jgi:hypothetical protein
MSFISSDIEIAAQLWSINKHQKFYSSPKQYKQIRRFKGPLPETSISVCVVQVVRLLLFVDVVICYLYGPHIEACYHIHSYACADAHAVWVRDVILICTGSDIYNLCVSL